MNDEGLKFKVAPQDPSFGGPRRGPRVGYVEGAIGGSERVMSLASLFPHVQFVSVGATWPDRPIPGLAALLVEADANDAENVIARLASQPPGLAVIVALREAGVDTTRRLARAGAADILPAPINEAALALSLERLLARIEMDVPNERTGQVVAVLKAGGGTGATALGTQLAAILAGRAGSAGVCFADLDLQFGQGALYLDVADAISITDIMGGGGLLSEVHLASSITRHRSGVRVLAAPREMTPLETLYPHDMDGLVKALKRDFAITLLDLPTVWTAWTHQALHLCDRIIMVTHLSVSHINLVQRQLKVMATQDLDRIPLTLVCNQLNADQQSVVSLKTAQKAVGRAFDFVIPEDRRLMNEAISQGREISTVRAGSKLGRAIGALAESFAPVSAIQTQQRTRFWS